MHRKSAESSAFHGIIETAPKSACNTRQGLTRSSGTSREGLPTMVPKICAVEACERKQHSHNYCPSHVYRWHTYGDPLASGRMGRRRQETLTYQGVHKRLSRDKGKAAAHCCVDCGNRAHEWSYDGGCPNELYETLEKLPIAYSTDQTRYSPRCRSCHRNRDESLSRPRGTDGRFMA